MLDGRPLGSKELKIDVGFLTNTEVRVWYVDQIEKEKRHRSLCKFISHRGKTIESLTIAFNGKITFSPVDNSKSMIAI